jgi:hypothetical protein
MDFFQDAQVTLILQAHDGRASIANHHVLKRQDSLYVT